MVGSVPTDMRAGLHEQSVFPALPDGSSICPSEMCTQTRNDATNIPNKQSRIADKRW
jgi:hypothetical protein